MGQGAGKERSDPRVQQEVKAKSLADFIRDVRAADKAGRAGLGGPAVGVISLAPCFRDGIRQKTWLRWTEARGEDLPLLAWQSAGAWKRPQYAAVVARWNVPPADQSPTRIVKMDLHQFYYIQQMLMELSALAGGVAEGQVVAVTAPAPAAGTGGGEDDEDDEDDECLICMDARKEVVLPCTHAFCQKCYDNWLAETRRDEQKDATCPMCRATLKKMDSAELWQLEGDIDDADTQTMTKNLTSRLAAYLAQLPSTTGGGPTKAQQRRGPASSVASASSVEDESKDGVVPGSGAAAAVAAPPPPAYGDVAATPVPISLCPSSAEPAAGLAPAVAPVAVPDAGFAVPAVVSPVGAAAATTTAAAAAATAAAAEAVAVAPPPAYGDLVIDQVVRRVDSGHDPEAEAADQATAAAVAAAAALAEEEDEQAQRTAQEQADADMALALSMLDEGKNQGQDGGGGGAARNNGIGVSSSSSSSSSSSGGGGGGGASPGTGTQRYVPPLGGGPKVKCGFCNSVLFVPDGGRATVFRCPCGRVLQNPNVAVAGAGAGGRAGGGAGVLAAASSDQSSNSSLLSSSGRFVGGGGGGSARNAPSQVPAHVREQQDKEALDVDLALALSLAET